MTAPRELRATRLLLRSIKREDIPALVRLAGAREIAATTLGIPHPYAVEDAHNYIAKSEGDFLAGRSVSFAICTLPEGEFCGAVGLAISEAHRRAELGYWIGVPFWGRGYATEAASAVIEFGFEDLRLNRIYAHYSAGNIGSQRVLQKIGMRHEGRSDQHVQKWDRFIDIENCGMLAKDFRSRRTT
jgi:[ribosomal protein S5]-alanine N-acetyltransferase